MSEPKPKYDPGSSLAVVGSAELGPIGAEMQTWRLMRQQADVLVKSGFLGSVKTAEQALAIIVLGQELGFQRMQSFRLIDVINGKPTLNSHGMATLVQRYCRQYGGYLRVVESTAERAVIEFKRPEWSTPHQLAFTTEDAKRAGLLMKDGPWKQYPQNMLYARALANACRMGFPDVVGGIYDPDELGGAPTAGFMADEAYEESVSIGPGLDGGERVDLATGEIIEAQDRDPKETAMRRLHAIGTERGLDHDGIKRVAAALLPAAPSSLSRWSEQMLRDLANHIEETAEQGETVDLETGEIVDSDEEMSDDDKDLIQYREQVESAFADTDAKRRGNALAGLVTSAADDAGRWLALVAAAPTLSFLRYVRQEHLKSEAKGDQRVVDLYNRRNEQLQAESAKTLQPELPGSPERRRSADSYRH